MPNVANDRTAERAEVDQASPNDGRTSRRGESGHGGDESVERQLAGASGRSDATASPAQESPVRDDELTDEEPATPKGVGKSTTRRGEDVVDDDGKEPGRHEGGVEHESERPTGYSDDRDLSGT